jgi:RNA polymerase sigma factor (sigma-70 family)
MATATLSKLLGHIRKLAAGRCAYHGADRQLLDDFAARRDEAAFTALVSRHGPMVLHVCRRVLSQEQDAEDAFQATFLVLARHAASIRKRDTIAGWLHGVAFRTAMKAKRSAARRRNHENRLRSTSPPKIESPNWDDVQSVLDEELQRLPGCYREAFVLCILEGKSSTEAAAELGSPEGTVKSRVSRARRILQDRLARRGIQLAILLAALSVAAGAGRAALPASLAQSVVRFGLLVAAGKSVAGILPSHIAALAAGVTRTMFLNKIKIVVALLLALGFGVGGATILVHGFAQAPANEAASAKDDAIQPKVRSADATKEDTARRREVSGRVLDPSGKPVAGARLFAPRPRIADPIWITDFVLKQVGTADVEGHFKLDLVSPTREDRDYLVAYAPGFGVDWVGLGRGERLQDIALRLVKDVPITGRVINTEGRPIAGASVSVSSIFVPAHEKLDDFLAGWLRDWRQSLSTPQKRLVIPLDGVAGAAETDKDGRFTLRGAGSERIVQLSFAGAGLARANPHVITRAGFNAGPYNAVLRKAENRKFLSMNPFPGLYAPALMFVAEPGRTIEGTVKDAAGGKPIAGCRLWASVGWGASISAVSDAGGHYRLEGLPIRAGGYDVFARAPTGAPYLIRHAHAASVEGNAPIQLGIVLVRGAVVTGRVVDKQTGKGVLCGIRFAPLPGNKFFGSKPGFDNYRHDLTNAATLKDGRFRLVTIPGKALIMAQVYDGIKFHGEHLCIYRNTDPDPDYKNLFKRVGESNWSIDTANGLELLGVENAVKVIDVKEKGETEVTLYVERGTTARIAVHDADGKPITGAWAAGLADHWPITYKLPEATATVYALDPSRPRTLAFYHAERKLGGIEVVRGDEMEPVRVKLTPVGKVCGRLLDNKGNALEGVEVSVAADTDIGGELYRIATPSAPAITDKDGRFCLENVIPDLAFSLNMRQGALYYAGEPRIGTRRIKSGETLQMGDVRVKAR